MVLSRPNKPKQKRQHAKAELDVAGITGENCQVRDTSNKAKELAQELGL